MYKFHLNFVKLKKHFFPARDMQSILLLMVSCMLLPLRLKAEGSTSPKVNLSSPYDTVHTHFMFLSPGNESLKKAGIIFMHGEIYPGKDQKTAIKLKKLLTFHGVNVDAIPKNPNYIDPIVNEHRYILCKKLPQVYLIKHGEEWRYSEETFVFIRQYRKECKLEILLYSFLPKEFCKNKILDLAIWKYIVLIGLALTIWLIHKIAPYLLRLAVYKLIGSFYGKRFAIERLVLLLSTIFLLKTTLPVLQFERLDSFMNRVLEATIAFVLMCLAYECVGILQERIKITNQHNKFMIHILPLYSMLAKVIIIVFGLVKTIDSFGFGTESLIKALSFSTLGLGLASQDTIKNLFGSLMIIMDSPFSVGDEIVSGGIRGKVEEIGLRATLLRTKEGSLVYIPNAKLADAYIDNFGRRTLRMIALNIPISYKVSLDLSSKFIEGLEEIATQQPFAQHKKTEIYFDKINENGFVIVFNVYLDTPASEMEREYKNAVIPLILKLANELGVHLGTVEESV